LQTRHRGQDSRSFGVCRAQQEQFRESDALRQVFEVVAAMCIEAGLVGGEFGLVGG
jgi:hypothetical protein